jgi:hypothetical protein
MQSVASVGAVAQQTSLLTKKASNYCKKWYKKLNLTAQAMSKPLFKGKNDSRVGVDLHRNHF